MYTADITAINKVFHQETSDYFLDVVLDVKKDGVSQGEKRLGFPLDTDQATIVAAIQDMCGTLKTNNDIAERNKALDEANAQADQTIANLVGQTLSDQNQ